MLIYLLLYHMTQEGVQVVKVVDIDMEIRPLPKHSKNKEVVWLFDQKLCYIDLGRQLPLVLTTY